MQKAATLNMRIEPALKRKAEGILHQNGLSSAQAIRIFYSQICMHHGLPFEVKIPNSETRAAIDELEMGKGHVYKDMAAVWQSLNT